MSSDFHLLDLPSQGIAVQRLLRSRTTEEKLAWLEAHGELWQVPRTIFNTRQIYSFVSCNGMECAFFIDGDVFVFLGDTTYTAKEYEPR